MSSASNATSPAEMIQHLLAGPAAASPPGHTSVFGGPNPFAPAAIADLTAGNFLAFIAIAVRLYTQHFYSEGIVTEDFFIVVAALLHIGFDVTGLMCSQQGIGKHMWNITLGTLVNLLRGSYIFSIFYAANLAFIKIAILLQFVRIFTPSRINKPVWFACWACISAIAVFSVIFIFILIFQCIPVQAAWNRLEPGHCLNVAGLYEASATFNIVMDFAMLVIPIPTIIKLNMTLRRKLAVLVVFAAGLLACVASIMRLYYTVLTFHSQDMSFYVGMLGVWCGTEASIGIYVFCLPKLHQFYYIMKKAVQHSGTSTSGSHASAGTPVKMQQSTPRQIYEVPRPMLHGPRAQSVSTISTTFSQPLVVESGI